MNNLPEAGIDSSENFFFEEAARIPRWKRAVDCTVIWLLLPILLPLFFFISITIWLVSGGPVFFQQERVGHGGRRFSCFKFRTMKVGNHSVVHKDHLAQIMDSGKPMMKMDAADSRIIPMGRLLRASGLDELPQLINVLRGEMSVVGPRPCLPYEYERFSTWQKARFSALPGLTGLWQVSGKNKTTFDEMIDLDIRYASSQSVQQDVKIIVKTVPVLVGQALETRKGRRTALRQAQLKTILMPGVNSPTRCGMKPVSSDV